MGEMTNRKVESSDMNPFSMLAKKITKTANPPRYSEIVTIIPKATFSSELTRRIFRPPLGFRQILHNPSLRSAVACKMPLPHVLHLVRSVMNSISPQKPNNVSIHRARTSKLNIKARPRKGSVCNALLSRGMDCLFSPR